MLIHLFLGEKRFRTENRLRQQSIFARTYDGPHVTSYLINQ